MQVLGHKLGHLFGITDLYNVYTNLDNIYSQWYSFTTATRHDKNAMRIRLNNPEFYTRSGWKYQKSPGIWAANESVSNHYYNASGFVQLFHVQ